MKLWGAELKVEGILHRMEHVNAFDSVDRRDFLPKEYREFADLDEPIPIYFGQTQTAPHMDGIFIDYGNPSKDESVLEIGSGTGYLTKILSLLSRTVVSIERIPELSLSSYRNISKYGMKNIYLVTGNIYKICFKIKFDLILSTASFDKEPLFLRNLLNENGRLIYPLGSSPPQRLVMFNRGKRKEIGWVSFVNIVH